MTHAAEPDGEQSDPPGVDIQQLANKVYQLMLAEVRLGLARGEAMPAAGREASRAR